MYPISGWRTYSKTIHARWGSNSILIERLFLWSGYLYEDYLLEYSLLYKSENLYIYYINQRIYLPAMVEFMHRSTKNLAWIFCICKSGFMFVAASNWQSCCLWLVDHAFIHWKLEIIVIVIQAFSPVMKLKRLNHIFDVRAKPCLWSVNRGTKTERASPVCE